MQLLISGTHLSPEFGNTYEEIIKDGFTISDKVELVLSSDSPHAICQSIALGIIGFSTSLNNLKPDLLIILGDRYEALACAQAAMINRVPIAHIHGGEITEGAVDEAIRHSITKMAHLHFTSTEDYRKRVIQLGENPQCVFNFGAMGVECINNTDWLSRDELERDLGIKLQEKLILMTYHPVTLEAQSPLTSFKKILKALEKLEDFTVIATYPNSDTNGRVIIEALKEFKQLFPNRVYISKSLGQQRYFSLMKLSTCVLGNSSSGVIEAPILKVPSINIGDRQKGRFMADSVISCIENTEDIIKAVNRVHTKKFINVIKKMENPFGEGEAARKILNVIVNQNLKFILKKKFHDI